MDYSWNVTGKTLPKETGKYLIITEDGDYQIAKFIRCTIPGVAEMVRWETNHGELPKYWTELPEKPKTLKVFISQPMSGRTADEIVEERAMMIRRISQKYSYLLPLQIVDSFNPKALNDGNPIEELGKCISLMHDADYVVFANNWDKSKGCRTENFVATEYGIKRIYPEDYMF
ncbi:hypothetical protein RASY3_14560 [Ruminococcus albus SY3]|uniref:DUF4406 domain-containing protein n=1 Tax=Ruminococcus albus SY3 TaxID=1341156 RepID=A0A011VTI6_RUMAL|nr:DUF4406 domain-containing protein [Ruminococcus albus]EXM38541.1 hypothetical protein RASY3_14560 [Ruminococcus albus SY3]